MRWFQVKGLGDTQTGNCRVEGSWNQAGWGRGEEEKEDKTGRGTLRGLWRSI